MIANHSHILLVNSEAEIRATLRALLEDAGHAKISEGSCGLSASRVLRNVAVDLLITDIEMPDLDGWRLARLLRSGVFKCKSDIPIIVVAKTWCERIAETTAREFGVNAMVALDHHWQLPQVVRNCLVMPGEAFRNPSVLVVEDTPDTAQIAQRVLSRRFDVEIAEDGPSGLAAWMARRHDLVLLDTMLPGMSGPQVLREIMKIDRSQAVVAMTAFSSVELAEELMLQGAADFIAKPFMADQLRRVCELAVRREDYLVSNSQFAARVDALKQSTEAYRIISEAHQRLLANLRTVVIELDQDGKICFLNQAWTELTGFTLEESLHQPLALFLPSSEEERTNWFEPLLSGKIHQLQGEMCLRDNQGGILWVDCRLDASTSEAGKRSIFGCLDDISEHKSIQKQLAFLSMHDQVTGLYNRHYFEGALRRLAVRSARDKSKHALLCLDIDHFKVINDNFGHQQGDLILREIGASLLGRLRQSDVLCRLGGDEYAILIPHADQAQALMVAAEVAQVIQQHPLTLSDRQSFELSCSIGISEINGHGATPEDYLKQADMALYAAKRQGRNRIRVYDPMDRENDALSLSLNWASRLRHAIENDRLLLHFQPILHIASGKITHYEALVRLDVPGQGIAKPGEFIPALERAGEMTLLDHAVIKLAVRHLKNHPRLRRIAVNLSAQSFNDGDLVPLIEEQLRAQKVDPRRLMFELTENAGISNISATQRMIAQIKQLGCDFALDDFGTGFSTFGFLKQFPADFIKVDGSFIRHLDRDPIDQVLVKSICEVATNLGKQTIAEFVHNDVVLNLVTQLGIDYAQGFHIGQPQPVEDLQLP
ncbi:two-component system response regulator [Geoalkalibacter halelectricus]|uniref:EAL domain-containing protein n=1 Tax=Geoalkalibacter halelectricus TaxID=2847045 RepID=A0ABY5ZPG0_9BACT|nr:GGDEF domain-containing response regulator [Geoalkalibacter halelectricus]MDO3380082.1 EAL domain-containing protein [Geoalkalibacter halelectricus]UWZ80399.1 EAL domain-containing protein [Geoalkalibacter halelectricus]